MSLGSLEVVRVRALLAGVAADGLYAAGCSDLGDGLWLLTDKLERRYLRLYFAERRNDVPSILFGSISGSAMADPEEVKLVRLLDK